MSDEKYEEKYEEQYEEKSLREKVWRKNFGGDIKAKCRCGTDIFYGKNYECGHIIAPAKGGKTEEENLFPACRGCVRAMAENNSENTSLDDFFARFQNHSEHQEKMRKFVRERVFCVEKEENAIVDYICRSVHIFRIFCSSLANTVDPQSFDQNGMYVKFDHFAGILIYCCLINDEHCTVDINGIKV